MKQNNKIQNPDQEKKVPLEHGEAESSLPERVERKAEEMAESKENQIIPETLRREIELMEVEEGLKEEAHKKAQKIRLLGQEEKMKHLMEIVKTKGVVAAIKTAQALNDPYLLDTLHDILAREGYYQKFIK